MADMHSVVQTRTTWALQALSLTSIMRIPHDAIRSAAARLPALAEAFWRDCMVDTALLSQWVVNVGRRDAKARIGHLICEVATRLKVPMAEGMIRFPFAVTQHQLADATGLTAVHVNRILKTLRDEGLAEFIRREVRILDWQGLVKAAGFDRRYLQVDVAPHDRPRILAMASPPFWPVGQDKRSAGAQIPDGKFLEVGEAVMSDNRPGLRYETVAPDRQPVPVAVHAGSGRKTTQPETIALCGVCGAALAQNDQRGSRFSFASLRTLRALSGDED